jgi:hypothetical protein
MLLCGHTAFEYKLMSQIGGACIRAVGALEARAAEGDWLFSFEWSPLLGKIRLTPRRRTSVARPAFAPESQQGGARVVI